MQCKQKAKKMDKNACEIIPDVKKSLSHRIKTRSEDEIAPVDELLSSWFRRKVKEEKNQL